MLLNDVIKGNKAQKLIGYYLVIMVLAFVFQTILDIPLYINISILVASLILMYFALVNNYKNWVKIILLSFVAFMVGNNIVFLFNIFVANGCTYLLNSLIITIPLTLIVTMLYVIEPEQKYFTLGTYLIISVLNCGLITIIGYFNDQSIISIVIICLVSIFLSLFITKDFNKIIKAKEQKKTVVESAFLITIVIFYLPIRILINLLFIILNIFEK